MPDIRYVCLSDMHLGADSSILTKTSREKEHANFAEMKTENPQSRVDAEPVLQNLVACLRELIAQNESPQKPTLILNGDILELALAETNVAAMAFERFIELIFPVDGEALFEKHILY
ncbi:MAG TPA: hypothetical protein VFN35_10455, partial [Ktedonobacteraceae bacterium]|nr:hypothetical protein [Ktedonobacteraceae bacterium]